LSHLGCSHGANTFVCSFHVNLLDVTHWGLVCCETGTCCTSLLHHGRLQWFSRLREDMGRG
jgi:hypothetical protein